MPIPKNNLFPKTLIVGTLPYHPNESSRALGTYFSNWPEDKLRMIFSNRNKPYRGHCESYFQIHDIDLFKSYFKTSKNLGNVFYNNQLIDTCDSSFQTTGVVSKLKKKNTLRFILRKMLWGRKKWYSNKLKAWIDEFDPELIYICFSDDYFILDIAYTIATEKNIPIVCQISDDYYFCNQKNKNPFFSMYFKKYRKLFDKIMETNGFSIYISDTISTKYNQTFKKQGFPIYMSSSIVTPDIQERVYEFNYLGKINLDRYNSLAQLGASLYKINPEFKLNVYTNECPENIQNLLESNHCVLKHPVPYEEVVNIMTKGAFNIIASGFKASEVEKSKYSLSTKVADSLISKSPIIAIGDKEDGAISYLLENNCSFVISELPIDVESLKKFIFDEEAIKTAVQNYIEIYNRNHDFEKNNQHFISACQALKGGKIK